jgi:hypothetical protein
MGSGAGCNNSNPANLALNLAVVALFCWSLRYFAILFLLFFLTIGWCVLQQIVAISGVGCNNSNNPAKNLAFNMVVAPFLWSLRRFELFFCFSSTLEAYNEGEGGGV